MTPTDEVDFGRMTYKWAANLPPKVINRISPSSLGGCMRKHFLTIKHVPITTPINPGAIINMQTGFMWEKVFTDALHQEQRPFIEQWKMTDEELNMEGTLDYGILKLDPGTDSQIELEIWDSKTESSLAYKYRQGSYLNSHEEYVDQLNCYAVMARRKGFKVTRGGFGVVRRDDSFIENFPFVFDEMRIAKTMERVKTLQGYLDRNELPPCDGKFCQIGLCDYGNPLTRTENKKGKLVNATCCEVGLWEAFVAGKEPYESADSQAQAPAAA